IARSNPESPDGDRVRLLNGSPGINESCEVEGPVSLSIEEIGSVVELARDGDIHPSVAIEIGHGHRLRGTADEQVEGGLEGQIDVRDLDGNRPRDPIDDDQIGSIVLVQIGHREEGGPLPDQERRRTPLYVISQRVFLEKGEIPRLEVGFNEIRLSVEVEIGGGDGPRPIGKSGAHGKNSPCGPGARVEDRAEKKRATGRKETWTGARLPEGFHGSVES